MKDNLDLAHEHLARQDRQQAAHRSQEWWARQLGYMQEDVELDGGEDEKDEQSLYYPRKSRSLF